MIRLCSQCIACLNGSYCFKHGSTGWYFHVVLHGQIFWIFDFLRLDLRVFGKDVWGDVCRMLGGVLD